MGLAWAVFSLGVNRYYCIKRNQALAASFTWLDIETNGSKPRPVICQRMCC